MKSFLHLLATVFLVLIVTVSTKAEQQWNKEETKLSLGTSTRLLSNDRQTSADSTISHSLAYPNTSGATNGFSSGLLASGFLSYLSGNTTFENIQLIDFLLFLGVTFLFFKLLRSDKSSQPVSIDGAKGYFLSSSKLIHAQKNHDLSRVMSNSQNQTINLPDNFDTRAFTQDVLSYYRLIQRSCNTEELNSIRSYVSPAVFTRLTQQYRELPQPAQTDVLDLSADIIHADQSGTIRTISILFRGRCRDRLKSADNGIFDTWYLEQDACRDDAPWQVVCMKVA